MREETVDTTDEDGIVIDQDPAGGEQRKKGSRVTITVGRSTPPLNPRAHADARDRRTTAAPTP